MEDQGRGVESFEHAEQPVKRKPAHEDRFTVMVMRSVGKVLSFEISPRFLLWAGIFLLGYISFSLYLINGYFELQQANSTYLNRIGLLESEISGNRKTLHRFRQHIALLEDFVEHPGERREQESEVAKVDGSQGRRQDSAAGAPAKGGTPVDINDLVIQRDGSRMTLDFKLVNLQAGDSTMGGYIHIIARGKDPNPPDEWIYPRQRLIDGAPSNFRNGQIFFIQRYKQIRARFKLSPGSSGTPSTIKVLVYDQSGGLLLAKEFEVGNVS